MASPDQPNPYRAPETEVGSIDAPLPSSIDPGLPKKFRDQALALGAVWIIIGALAIALAVFISSRNTNPQDAQSENAQRLLLIVVGALGAAWCVLGVLTCRKIMWAMYTGLILSYLSLIGNVLNLNLGSLIFLIPVIIQAHRVIGWGRQLQAAGVPLTARS